MREFFDAGVAPARGQILARSRAVARWAKAVWLICLLASLLPSAYAQTTTRGFGNGANQFTMDFVTIGNPNNPADTTGQPNPAGSVAYTYNLGKHEVSRDMINKANTAGGLGITLPDMTSFGGNGTNRPATGISWYEAARFVNWLNTSQGYQAAYKFSGASFAVWTNGDVGYQAGNPYRNTQARYFLPSSDEWYKGAYGSPSGTWYNYATGSDANPTAVTGGTNASTAVYSQASATGPANITNAGGLSAYGTMAQSGNIHEWMETATDGINNSAAENRDWRGGRWTDGGSSNLSASSRFDSPPTDESATILGFRVASADLTALDSDGDGLSDAVETNTGVFVSASGTGTNPNNPDTDGDGISDDVEVNTLNSNPNDSQIPEALVTQQSGANGFVATWGAVTGAAGYEVQVSTEPSFTSGLIGGDRPVSLGTTTSLGITGISGQIRYYRVRSVLPSLGGPVKTAWSSAVSAPDRSAFGKYATLNATGNADSFQAAVGSSANNNSYTISFWMRPDQLGGVSGSENVQVFRQPINNNASAANVDIDLLPDGSLVFGQRSEAGEEHFVSTPADTVHPGNWVHVTAVRDATNAALRLYINGVEIAAKTLAFGTNTWNIVNSGGPGATQAALNNDSNVNRIRAAFDDVRIYRTVRTPAQILQDVGAPLAVAAANADSTLVFYAPMEGSSLSSTDANSFFKGTLNGSGSGTISSQSVLTAPILAWTPSPINLVAPAVLSTNELTATATAPTGGPVSGSWSYLPAAGTSLSNGTNEVVGTFVPTDLVTYAIGTITNQIVVTDPSYSVPGVETGPTNSISGLTQTSVKLMGGITNLGGTTVTNAGFYLNTNSTATNGVKYSAPGTSFGLGSFSNTITGLTPGTSYYYRAFAANSAGTGYGSNEYSFTTPSPSPFTYTNNGTGLTITGYTGTGGVVEIPATIGGVAVTTIGQNAFQSKSSVTAVVIPNGVTTIMDAAFAGCSGMTAITLPSSLTSIGNYVFDGCSSLQSITIPDGVTSIGANAFAWCTSLTSITLPSGLRKILSGTFWTCNNLTSITIPGGVDEIQYNAFLNCSKLASVYFLGNTPPTIGGNAFAGIATGAKGYYPTTASAVWGNVTVAGLTFVQPPDTQSPVINLIGANPLEIYKGGTFADLGATVTDNKDATRNITGSGTVNTAMVGIYTLTYTATDASGNLALPVIRIVNVVLDPSGDEDGDGLTNGAEMSGGMNPYQKDSDNDGVNDALEIADGTNPTNPDSFNNLNKGLVAYYPFNGNAKNMVPDPVTDLIYSGPQPTKDRFGRPGYAFKFNASGFMKSTGDLPISGNSPRTISLWLNRQNMDRGGLVGWGSGNAGYGKASTLFAEAGGRILAGGFYADKKSTGEPLVLNQWMHLAMTYVDSIGSIKIFIDGSEIASYVGESYATVWDTQSAGYPLFIGSEAVVGGATFNGSIDDVRIYNRALSEAEVGQLYSAEKPNRAPVITGQSTTYDALAEFIDGPTLQSANSRWQYLGGNVSSLALLGNWKTTGNEIIQNQSQWDGNSGYLSNYPFVQRVNSASGPTSANTLVIHPSNLAEANRAVAIGWKNTSGQTVAANFNVNLRLPYGSANGIDYKLQRGLAGSSRYLSIRSGSLQAGGSVALASDALLEMQTGEMLYLIVDSKNNFDYDHTEVSAFTVTVAGGANLDSISQGVASASNSGTAVTVLTEGSSDADSDSLKGIAITGVDTRHGSWEYTLNGGSVWNSLSGVNIAAARLLKSDALHRVRFVPNANFSGNAEIRYQAWDQTSGEDGALADLTAVGGGAWVLVAYGANASLGGFLTAPSGSFSSSARTGSAVMPGSLDILKNSMELAMTWTASGGSFPSGGIGSYAHGIAFALPNAAGMSFDGSATSPLIYNNGANPLSSSFAVGSSNPDQSQVNVRTLVGSPGMPSQMYLRNKTFGAGYGSVYGLVMNDGSNAQLDYNQVPDSQTFKAVYLDHGTGAAQGQGLVMGGSGGASNSYVPSTMALWARLDPLQVLALNGGNPVSTSGNYLLDGISTSYVDVIDFDASGAFSAETATGTIHVLDASVPVITLIGANPLEIYKGATFSDPGATVTDNVDATRTITGSGTVNTATVGNYTLNYNTTDAAGNPAVQVTRAVNVVLDPAGDEDGDGVSNGAESSAGTNPLVKNILRFQTIDMLALGKGNFSIAESNGGGGAPVGFRYGTPAYYGGVPFFITDQSNQVWHAARAPGGNGTGVVSETFPIAVNNVYGFYTLAGLWWGVAGSYVTYTFNFSDGSSYSKGLINNVDLRDYNIPSSFANSINGTTTQNVFVSGNYHLDRQWIDFSAAGHGGKNLVSFTVTDRGASGSSRIFLAAATAQVGAPGQIPPGATDTDGDGILDSYELGLPLSTKPDDADTDDDGLSDGTEISGTTDPLVADVDNDGLKDGVEFTIGTNPLVADSDGDGTPDGDEDADNDGGSNRIEVGLGNSLTVANVYNRLINGSFEDGTVKPSPGGWRPVPQNDVPGWKTTANNEYTIELWYSGFLGSSGNVGNTLAELNYIASGTLYQDVTMTVNSPVSYSFLHRGRDGSDVMDFKIDELSGGPGTSVVNNKFTRRVTTGTSWIRYSGSQATEVEAGKTYRFSYTSISPAGGNGNLLDDASFGIDQDGDGLTDSVETNTGTYVSANNTGTNPSNPDSDNDGLKDGEEVITYGTNPLLADTDGDGAPDGVEVTAGTNPKQNSSLPKPGITLQPVSITRTTGEGVTFSVTATNPVGSPSALNYQWYKDGAIIPTGSNPTLIISPLTTAEAGNYSVVVSNSYGAVTSNIVSLSVNKATPTITTAPTATSIGYGQTLAFSTLSGGVASVPGSFAWTAPSTLPNAGTASQIVTFNPTDTANYNTATASVNVTVNQALISSGFSHTLYLGAGASTVTAWGMNTDGRLGVGDMNSPVNWAKAVDGIPVGLTVEGLSAGGTHSLILAGEKVYAAGSDRFGQLGQGAVNGASKTKFTPVVLPSSTPVAVAVAAGSNHSLIVTADGKVFACGDNTYGQLARSSTTVSSGTLVEVNFPGLSTKIVSVAAGADHNLAVDENGGVWVWGRNNYGQLGKGTRTAAERTPSNLAGVTARSVAAGFSHSLILETSGTVRGFGRNNCGQTGQSATSNMVLVPTLISGLSGIRSIAAGTDSSFAIDQAGQIRSWGYNAYGELLLGYASPISSPAVYGPTPSPIATNVFNVAGGGYSTLAVGVQGVIFGGRNDVGQSGNGPDPEQVVGDYYYGAGNLALTNLTMDLAGTTETLYDQIFVGNGTATLNGILNLMFVGTYSGPVYGSTQTFDLIWAKNGVTLGAGYQLAFNQAGYLVENAVVDKSVEGVSGKVLQATVRAVVTAADLAKAVDLARPSLDGVESVSYRAGATMGISTFSVSSGVEMIYSYERPTGGVSSGAQYFVNGITYRVEQVSSLNGVWGDASVSGTTVTPLGNGYERATLRISSSGGAGFLRLQVENPQATGINAGVGSAITY